MLRRCKAIHTENGPARIRSNGKRHRLSRSAVERWVLLLCVLGFAAMAALTWWRWRAVPAAKALDAPPEEFSAARAFEHVKKLEGMAVIGSKRLLENERYIYGQLEAMLRSVDAAAEWTAVPNGVQVRTPTLDAELGKQRVGGAYELDFSQLGDQLLLNLYSNVTNVVLRLSPRSTGTAATAVNTSGPDTLVVNSHYDTAPGSPGASDALTPIAVMLELVRAVLHTHHGRGRASNPATAWLQAPLIFLFNGAEESFLQGAHGFVSAHPHAPRVAALLNLESAGAGTGPEMLFRSGPRNAWLVRAYARAVPRPHTASYVQDVFEQGWIPAETDFRIFAEKAHVPGLDMALYQRGYTYHTEYDASWRVDPGAMQHMGDNAWAVLRELVGEAHALRHAEAARDQRAVYGDVLGAVMVVVDERTARYIYGLLVVVFGAVRWRQWREAPRHRHREYWGALAALFLTIAAGMLAALLQAVVFTSWVPRPRPPMWWFGRHLTLAPLLYAPPALAAALAVLRWLQRHWPQWMASGGAAFDRFEEASATLHVVQMAVMGIGLRYGTAYVWAVQVALHLLATLSLPRLGSARHPALAALARFTLLSVLSLPVNMPPMLIALETFAPLMGRAGGRAKVEWVMAGLVGYFTLQWWWALWLPLLAAYRRHSRSALRAMLALLLATNAVVCVAVSGGRRVPYSREAPKRMIVQAVHIDAPAAAAGGISDPPATASARRVVALSGMDPYPLESVMDPQALGRCASAVDGWGYQRNRSLWENLTPLAQHMKTQAWVCAAAATEAEAAGAWPLPAPQVRLVEDERLPPLEERDTGNATARRARRRLLLQVHAPRAHWSSLRFDAAVSEWSLTEWPPNGGRRASHFLRHVAGHTAAHLWNVSLVYEMEEDAAMTASLTVDVTSMHFGIVDDVLPPTLQRSRLPDWLSPVYITARFASYQV
ncbi:hypothetical protein CDCA_CDCA17G4379 [Cyanidium caldarium]|uniref:Peptidase M28 domain-containing protein n=1 Tax=Cyanidium caldarium TaxID=2771 RepID=A0AAV9J207_CYACA|nr:hypothetical protein CDCA_CDCA17G4379 [Cyanidium caldarium]